MDGADQLNLVLSNHQAAQFIAHARLLLAWNQKINLTAITDPVEVAVKHFLDSVAPLAHLSIKGELLDMGTGGGFPGIPLKIMRPGHNMTLSDGTRKKINFVKQVIRDLGLNGIEAVHQRVEEMAALDAYAGRYATIVSRAVADLKTITLLARPLLAAKGKIMVYKGPREHVPERIVLAPKDIKARDRAVFKVTSIAYQLPLFKDRRKVAILEVDTTA